MDKSTIDKLKELGELYKIGILTKKEFKREKEKILGRDNTLSQSGEKSMKESEDTASEESGDTGLKRSRKKAWLYVSITFLIVLGISIFAVLYFHRQNQSKISKEKERSELAASLMEAEEKAKQKEDSIRKDSIIRYFSHPELDFFNLQCKVKRVVTTSGSDYLPTLFPVKEIEFTENGSWKMNHQYEKFIDYYIGVNKISKLNIKRNKDGYIIKLDKGNEELGGHADLKWQTHQLKSISGGDAGYGFEAYFIYNNDVIFEYIFKDFHDTYTGQTVTKYKDFEFDKYGNWIKCRYYMKGISEYHDEEDWDKTKKEYIGPDEGVIERTIEYYE